MKRLLLILLIHSMAIGMEPALRDKAREAAMADSPPSSQKSVIVPETYESFDCLFEHVRVMHPKMCICIECLEQSHHDLEVIADKLAMLKEKKIEDGPVAIAAARVVAKIINMAKNCENSSLIKSPVRAKSRTSSPAREMGPDSFGTVKITHANNPFSDQEFENLTDPDQENFKWRLKDAGLI